MAIFLGAKGGDVLTCRGAAELVDGLQEELAEKMAYLLAGEELELLQGLKERLAVELAMEERFAAAFADVDRELAEALAEAELAAAYQRAMWLVADYFKERGSVLASHSLCTRFQETVIRRALQLTAEWMERDGNGTAPAPFCWLAFGSLGRQEGAFSGECGSLFVHGAADPEEGAYFERFCPQAASVLQVCGIQVTTGITASGHAWFGSMAEWRSWLTGGKVAWQVERDFTRLLTLADLRQIEGDGGLAAGLLNLVRGLLDFHQGALRELARGAATDATTRAATLFPMPALRNLAKSIAEMPIGFDFFGRLRVDRSRKHRGEFNLEQFALAPLVVNIRLLAIKYGLAEPATVGRVKGLVDRGGLSVELAERLLRAYHDFTRQKLLLEIRDGAQGAQELFFNPEELTEEEMVSFKNGLEAVGNLQRIVYQSFVEQS